MAGSLGALNVQMPYYDLYSDSVLYYAMQAAYEYDTVTGYDDLAYRLVCLAWANYNNPDWKLLGQRTPAGSASGSGELTVGPLAYGVGAVEVEITDGATLVNKWYQSTDFANFGVYKLGNFDDDEWGDGHWVNDPTYYQNHPAEDAIDSVKLLLKAGVSATLNVYAKTVIPNISYNTTVITDPYTPFLFPSQGIP